jgi:hypothetical protein
MNFTDPSQKRQVPSKSTIPWFTSPKSQASSHYIRHRCLARFLAAAVLLTAVTVARISPGCRAPIYLIHDEVNYSVQASALAATGRDLNGGSCPSIFQNRNSSPAAIP